MHKHRKSKSIRHVRDRVFDKERVIEDIMNLSARDKLNVFCTSWNMGNAEAEGLQHIFHEENRVNEFDIFVIGLQESTYAMKAGSSGDCIQQLSSELETALGSKFYKVAHCFRAQLQMYVFAKRSLERRISSVEMSIENTGFLHVFPNKGGLLVTMKVDGTRLAFVSCHLTAHEGVNFCEERNASIVEILGGVRAGDKRLDITEQFHHVFWMGDMNYRITFDTAKVPANTKKNVKKLHDQVDQLEATLGGAQPDMKKPPSYRAECVTADADFSDSDSGGEADVAAETDSLLDGIDCNVASADDVAMVVEKLTDKQEKDSTMLSMPTKNRDHNNSTFKARANSKAGNEKEKPEKRERRAAIRRTHNMIVLENWEELLKFDELNREIAAGRVLNGFVALQPNFPPTFKRSRGHIIQRRQARPLSTVAASSTASAGTSVAAVSAANTSSQNVGKCYDIIASDDTSDANKRVDIFYNDKRMPSFTDRILYKSMDTFNGCVVPMFFESVENATSSDHKPVRAGFEVYLSKGEQGIFLDRQLLNWTGKISRKTSGERTDVAVLKMVVRNLKGTNLEELDSALFGGGSDPYVIITCDPSSVLLYKGVLQANNTGLRTKTVWRNLNPHWKEPIVLMLASVDLKGLARNATLIFSVWDQDRMNADDIIGVYTVPIREILRHALGSTSTTTATTVSTSASSNSGSGSSSSASGGTSSNSSGGSFEFDEEIRTNSEVMGRLSGSISVEGDAEELLNAYVAMEQDRLSTEQFVTLEQAVAMLPPYKEGCYPCCIS